MARYGMVIDLKKCVGCTACAMACKAENATPAGVWWNRVLTGEQGKGAAARRTQLPLMCMHCANAPCAQVCPTGATQKRPDGIVVVDYDKCIGCRYCQTACPYDARSFVDQIRAYYPKYGPTPFEKLGYARHQAGVVEKCDLCLHRVEKGQEPACVQTCISYARTFGDLDDPNSEVSRLITTRHGYTLKPELGTGPSVYYLPA